MSVRYIATSDIVDTCDCCSKTKLKKTVILDIDGTAHHYGVVCAGRALGRKTKNVDDVKKAVDFVNNFEKIKYEVLSKRIAGECVVYGRFYIGTSQKTKMMIAAPNENMLYQAFPKSL